ncbi:hypothetical protein [Pseudocolwellia agarivorans]|nr:hypothetical protein [Pseudocolwellia agarivorans]
MSEDTNFKESSHFGHLLIATLVALAMPLLPMLMGWYAMLS